MGEKRITPEDEENDDRTNESTLKKRRSGDGVYMRSFHRLHYRWSNIEADRCRLNVGSPWRPLPKAHRTLELEECREYSHWSQVSAGCAAENDRFANCNCTYRTMDYNTFVKNGCLKLTEVELFFLSSHMTKASSGDWAVVYLGIGNGERFRYLRDEFFPDLTVIGFDPLDEFFTGCRDEVEENAKRWTNDGTHFTFLVQCFHGEHDVVHIEERVKGKKLLLISDIRGIAFTDEGTFDKEHDQEIQWQAIKHLSPVSSLVKFTFPDSWTQFFDYVPGVVLKQVFCYYGSREVRLMIDGVPQQTRRYNAWELYEKMVLHHSYFRGQVYETSRRADSTRCLDNCFDCTVLWDTVSMYAAKNGVDPDEVLSKIVRYQLYTPVDDPWRTDLNWEGPVWKEPGESPRSQRWWDVVGGLQIGDLQRAIAALEAGGGKDEEDKAVADWAVIVKHIWKHQPDLASRLSVSIHRPAAPDDLIRALGSLADPFTLLRTELNCLYTKPTYLHDPGA